MEKMDTAILLEDAFNKGIDYSVYSQQMNQFVAAQKTSGSNQSEALIDYTKLNLQRMNRWDKKAVLSDEIITTVKYINKPQHWIVITEAWCGDAAHNIPAIAKIASHNDLISLRFIYRDENLEVMDQFLTNGGRSIPKLIATNEKFEVLFSWGPRPEGCQKLYQQLKAEKADFETSKIALQKWYNADKQVALQEELLALIQETV